MLLKLYSSCVHTAFRVAVGYAAGLPWVGIALLGSRWIIGLYTDNPLLVPLAVAPFTVMLCNYVLALPGYVFIQAVTGTGQTKIAFLFQAITIVFYLIYLYGLSRCRGTTLTVYLTAEYVFVILLAAQSFFYLKIKNTRK